MGKVKYSEDMKLQTVKYVLEGGKSATKVSKELGIETNTVWQMPFVLREADILQPPTTCRRLRI